MNKAFTLAELMGVIVILGIIAAVVTFAVDQNIKKGKVTTCLAQEKSIIEAAKTWSIDNPTGTSVSIETLKSGGYLDDDLKNPMTGVGYKNGTNVAITITQNANEHNYQYKINYVDEKGCS
ncbi:MAG: prepilin-type N-terminal cleavage/methylation domain-containing protein [Alphaproteobacteria bacterium]|nr:prepilin-type N-terminal cleavage/methylation domain-containing protein [Alphaproteobacteria bacterium]